MRSVSKHASSPHLLSGLVFSLVREGKSPLKKARCKQGLKIVLVDSRQGQEDVEGGRGKKKATLTKGRIEKRLS